MSLTKEVRARPADGQDHAGHSHIEDVELRRHQATALGLLRYVHRLSRGRKKLDITNSCT